MKKLILFNLLFCIASFSMAQVFTNKEVGKKNEALADSLKASEYPYSLPILGAKATKAGYNLPYSAGVSVQYFGTNSAIVIENLSVGFNNGPMYNLNGIVRFDESTARGGAMTVRPDIWLFPFLNVYGIFGKSQASTEVNFGVWIPEGQNPATELFKYSTMVEFNTTTFGIGMTPTIGVGGGFLALDLNTAWTDVPQLAKPAQTFVVAPRFGKAFKLKKPQSNIAVWVGAFRVKLSSETRGSINLADVLPEDGNINTKIDQGIEKVGQAQQNLDAWWSGLSQIEQNNPVNKAKYEAAGNALDRAGELLNAADEAVANISASTVQYAMDKRVKDPWNFIVGAQYQVNKHFMARFEAGFLGSRNQIMAGLQYRFGL